jgi:hypothetical protein
MFPRAEPQKLIIASARCPTYSILTERDAQRNTNVHSHGRSSIPPAALRTDLATPKARVLVPSVCGRRTFWPQADRRRRIAQFEGNSIGFSSSAALTCLDIYVSYLLSMALHDLRPTTILSVTYEYQQMVECLQSVE